MRGNMMLETTMKMFLLLVGLMIMISIFKAIGTRLRGAAEETFAPETRESLMVKGTFGIREIAKFVGLCRAKASEKPEKEFICYILSGSFPDGLEGGDFTECNGAENVMVVYRPGSGVGLVC